MYLGSNQGPLLNGSVLSNYTIHNRPLRLILQKSIFSVSNLKRFAVVMGFEPTISSVTGKQHSTGMMHD